MNYGLQLQGSSVKTYKKILTNETIGVGILLILILRRAVAIERDVVEITLSALQGGGAGHIVVRNRDFF